MSLIYDVGGVAYDPYRHRLVDNCIWVSSMRSRLRDPDLFVYHHKVHKSWVLARWWVKPGTGNGPGLMMELEVLDDNPDLPTSNPPCEDRVRMLSARWGETYEKVEHQLAADKLKEDEKKEANAAYQQDLAKFLKRRIGIHYEDHPDIKAMEEGGSTEVVLPDPKMKNDISSALIGG